jgi:hypothetical protein
MAFHRYDDRTKDREKDSNDVAAFLESGGEITRVPNGQKMKKLRRSRASSDRKSKDNGLEVLFDLNQF